MEFYWFIPTENMTEKRFSDTLKRLAALPESNIPVYEPDHPDAPLFQSVRLPSDNILVHGVPMYFSASTTYVRNEGWLELPEGIDYLMASWRKTDVSSIPPYSMMFLTTIATVADGMGAVFGTYTMDTIVCEFKSFREFFKNYHSYLFLSNTDVELVGLDTLEGMGTTVPAGNGLAILLDGPFANEAGDMLATIEARSSLVKGIMRRPRHEIPDHIERVQGVPSPPPSGRVNPGPDHSILIGPEEALMTFFVFRYPSENNTIERYESFFASLWERKKNPRLQGLPFVPMTPREEAETLLERGEFSTYLGKMDSDAFEVQGGNDVGIRLLPSLSSLVRPPAEDEVDDMMAAVISTNKLVMAEHLTQFVRILELFDSSLGPVHGHGSSNRQDFVAWWREGMDPLNSLWPINMFTEEGALLPKLTEFFDRHADRWSMHSTVDGHVFLVHNDTSCPRDALDGGALARALNDLNTREGSDG